MTLLYTLAYLDRANIGNARVAGMEADLNLTPEQYNLVLTMFFVTYSTFEPLSSSMFKIVKISTWFWIIVTCWGIVSWCAMRSIASVNTPSGYHTARHLPYIPSDDRDETVAGHL